MNQPTLPTAARAHDLPPRWDGQRVEWGGWRDDPIFVCPPPRQQPTCHFCGSPARPLVNHGRVWTKPGAATLPRARTYQQAVVRQAAERNGVVVLHLWAYRCPDCRRDHVDTIGGNQPGESWDLDDTDYDDDGSWIR